MHYFYTFSIYCYNILIHFASFFNPKAKAWIKGRKGYQSLPVMNILKKKDPSIYFLITFFSPSGFLHYHKRKNPCDFVCYLPLDTPSNAKKFLAKIHPQKIFFVKYEFWANYIFEAKKNDIKIYSISSIFRPNQLYFKKSISFFPSILKQFDYFFVQNQQSASLLKSIGISNYIISGDTRFDRVIENKNLMQSNPTLEKFLNNEKALIIGSSWPEEEKIIIPLINQHKITCKIIIAPHSIDENHLAQIEKSFHSPIIRYSNFLSNTTSSNVLLLDTIGHLACAYNYGEIAFIGGGFSGNLHNILEPAVFGLPVIFGPKHSRFPEAQDFIENGIGFSIETSDQFLESYQLIKNNLNHLILKSKAVVSNNQGASQKIIQNLLK
ncbi:MAG: 3-deoxy-D-manno-octulosonic acid transferase [Flavobacteriia bacterium]|nr:3-deoxy-D-manno-octulosonic acid transferase [Flavobacteriia bacterium]